MEVTLCDVGQCMCVFLKEFINVLTVVKSVEVRLLKEFFKCEIVSAAFFR